jgi:hypothetical protein
MRHKCGKVSISNDTYKHFITEFRRKKMLFSFPKILKAYDHDLTPSNTFTLKAFCQIFPWPSYNLLRHFFCHAKEYGIEKAIIDNQRSKKINAVLFFSLLHYPRPMKNTKKGYRFRTVNPFA